MRNGLYILIVAPEDFPGKKYRGRYCYEHHFIWWKNTGKTLKIGQVIHHVNENKHDNRIENLELMTTSQHSKHHGKTSHEKHIRIGICLNCQKEFVEKKWPKQIFCSRQCIGLYNHAGRKKNGK